MEQSKDCTWQLACSSDLTGWIIDEVQILFSRDRGRPVSPHEFLSYFCVVRGRFTVIVRGGTGGIPAHIFRC